MSSRVSFLLGTLLFAGMMAATWIVGFYLWSNWFLAALVLAAVYVSAGGFLYANENPHSLAAALGAMCGLLALIGQLFWLG